MEAGGFKEHDAASYDDHAELYGRYIERLAAPLADHLCALARVRPGELVLDVGCGTGIATRRAAALGASALGVDLSHGMIEAARRLDGAAEYAVMDAEALELSDASFDAVVSLCAVIHFPDIDRAAVEMQRVLKPGGRLAVGFGHPRPLSAAGLVARAVGRFRPGRLVAPDALRRLALDRLPEPGGHVLTDWAQRRPLARLREALQAAGFESLERSWRGHELHFDSPEEFWEAQLAIVTEARARLLAAPPESVEELHREFLRRARGAQLVFPYHAVFLSACKPAHM